MLLKIFLVALAYFGATEIVDHYTQFSFCAGVFPDIVTKHTAYNCKKIEKILNILFPKLQSMPNFWLFNSNIVIVNVITAIICVTDMAGSSW